MDVNLIHTAVDSLDDGESSINLIYIHSGLTSIITGSFIPVSGQNIDLHGIDYSDKNIVITCYNNNASSEYLYFFSGTTNSIIGSSVLNEENFGLTIYNGSRIVSSDGDDNIIIKVFSGLSSSLLGSFDISEIKGISDIKHDISGNLIISGYYDDFIYKTNQISSSILGSFSLELGSDINSYEYPAHIGVINNNLYYIKGELD